MPILSAMAMQLGQVTIDCRDPRALADFWQAALGLELEYDVGHFVRLRAPQEHGVSIGLQRVHDPGPGKNRVHLDCGTTDRAAEVERLVSLGATVVGEGASPELVWTILEDPAGNQFCVGEPA